ncbi:transglutaminase family protein, partial [Algibacter sp.]|nr:transglutaminase family protein [Algibacter sp.]
MLYQISHTTSYLYEVGVTFCHNIATIKPKNMLGQTVVDYKLEISPSPAEFSEKLDFFGNTITRFSIQEPHKTLKVTALSKILRDHTAVPDIYKSQSGKKINLIEALSILKAETRGLLDVKQFVLESILIANISKEIRDYAEVSFRPSRPIFEAAHELMTRIYNDFEFNSNVTNVATPIHEVIINKKGVCQDFAQIAIACIRAVGLPARYVSGYIETLPPPGKEKLVGTDASHAWFSIYIPTFGWVDFDPTNNQIPKDQHIIVAYGRDYYDVPPLKGVIYSSGKNKMKVEV